MNIKPVAVSGTVGKQVYFVASAAVSAGTQKHILKGIQLYGDTSAAKVVFRDGNASGTVVLQASCLADDSKPFLLAPQGFRFDKGLHVKVLGAATAVCYLYVD